MSKFATKAAGNMFCQARYEAAKFNERLSSREGAAEELGVDRTRLARIELGSVVSIFTGLVTEGIKKLLEESKKTYKANFLAGGVAVALSLLVGVGYIILMEAQINSKMAVYLIALILLSWLSAMVGYDKVIQSLGQIKLPNKNE